MIPSNGPNVEILCTMTWSTSSSRRDIKTYGWHENEGQEGHVINAHTP